MERIERGDKVELLEDVEYDVHAGDCGVGLMATPEADEIVVKVATRETTPEGNTMLRIVRVSPSTLRSL